MGEEPAAIREAIEDTRQEMGETLQQLAEKADVKGRAKEWAAEKKDAVTEKLGDAKDAATDKLGQAKGAATDKFGQAQGAVTTTLPEAGPASGNSDGKVDVVVWPSASVTAVVLPAASYA